MSFAFGHKKAYRRPSLTPMIDVVFLLLVFFMLAARFGVDGEIRVTLAGAGAEYSGPPRLVAIDPDSLHLNGRRVTVNALAQELQGLMQSRDDTILLRPGEGTDLQRVIDVMEGLKAQGFSNLVLVE